jgi:glycosyltransferase involved in cell wall biosynthesis
MPIRVTVVMTHPVQYLSPWLRHVAATATSVALEVLYLTRPTPQQQGSGFGVGFAWDEDLLAGYPARVLREARPRDELGSGAFFGVWTPEVVTALAAARPDVVLLNGWHSASQALVLTTAGRRGTPLIYRGDSNLLGRAGALRRPLWEARTRVLLGRFSAYLAVGRHAYAYLSRLGRPTTPVFASPHAVDNERFRLAAEPFQEQAARARLRAELGFGSEERVALFVGKLAAHKRVGDLIAAAARRRATALLIVGDGPLAGAWQAAARRAGVNARFTGFRNQGELGRFYAAADYLVLPSRETWGLVVNEALATGLPCLVSDEAGCAPDLVHEGETGAVFRLGDVDALVAAMSRVERLLAERPELARDCRRVVARHSFAAATEGLEAACAAVTARSRVLVVGTGFAAFTGLERMTFEVMRTLRGSGARVHCLINDWGGTRIAEEAARLGVTTSYGRCRVRLNRRAWRPRELVAIGVELLLASFGLVRAARRLNATHVLVPDYQAAIRNAFGLSFLRRRGVKVLLRVGNAPEPNPVHQWFWRHVIDRAVDRHVANSAYTAGELTKLGLGVAKIATVENVVPVRAAAREVSVAVRVPHRVIYVGQMIPEKGVDLLLEAAALVRRDGLAIELQLVGEIDGWESPVYQGYRQRLRQRAAAADLAGIVEFTGWREDVPPLLAGAGVHCVPSRAEQREAFGVVVLEAKAAGIPSVVTPSGQLPALVSPRVDGWVCRDFSVPAIAEGLAFFLSDAARRDRAGEAARRSLAHFGRSRFDAAWAELFALAGSTG